MKRTLLETLMTPIHAEDVKRVLNTPVFSRKDDHPPRLAVRQSRGGPTVKRGTSYVLGPHTSLIHLTFNQNLDLSELLEPRGDFTVSLRVWLDGFPTDVDIALPGEITARPVILQDWHDHHVYLTVVTKIPDDDVRRVMTIEDQDALAETGT